MADTFTFALPTRVVFGPGAIEGVGQEVAASGATALLVTGATFARRSGLVERLRRSLSAAGVDVALYDNLSSNPTVPGIDLGAELARKSGAQVVVGLGGGSAMDATKAIAAAARSSHSIWDHVDHGREMGALPVADALPIIQIPIIASTGSETNERAVVLEPDSRRKGWLRSRRLYARVAIVDPTLTFTVPPRYTAVGGMNIVSRMLETYLSSDEYEVTDSVAETLMKVAMDSLPRAVQHGEDLDARSNLSWVSAFAGPLTGSDGLEEHPLGAMAQTVCGEFQLEYGSALAALWPSFMRYAMGNRHRLPHIARFKRYARFGRRLLGVHETDDEVASQVTVFRFASWLRSMSMPTDLRSLGVKADSPGLLARQTVDVFGDGHRLPTGLSGEDIENVYEGALLLRS